MEYLPPYVIHGSHRLTARDIEAVAMRYCQLLTWMHDDQIDWEIVRGFATLGEALEQIDNIQRSSQITRLGCGTDEQ
jgi:glutathione-regulated potassium-efflux system ancillary protein KefG